ncbi:MAG: SRPBCC family protein [Candidatus Rokuibacteriota bacterium]
MATPAAEVAVERSRRGAINVGAAERLACVAVGGGLLLWGLIRRSPAAAGAAVVGAGLAYRGAAGRSLAYRMLGIRSPREGDGRVVRLPRGGGIAVERAMTIARPTGDLYRFWRNFENLPRLMRHVEAVRPGAAGRSHWVVRGPAGRRVQWEAEVTEDRAPGLIAWRSLPGGDVEHAGRVTFVPAPGGRGTVVRVSLTYRARGGKPGALLAKLLGEEPGQQVADDLRRLKQVLEAGEIPTTEGQPTARVG